jgi:hypothetical protein
MSTFVATCFTLVSSLAYYSTLKMEAKYSQETSVGFQRTTQCFIPENRVLRNDRCENLKYRQNLTAYESVILLALALVCFICL